MSTYHEPVRRVLSEISKFLKVTLQTESLSSHAENERSKILKLLQALFADYDTLAPGSGDEGSVSSSKDLLNGSLDESRNTLDSHGSEEDSYADNIADTTVKALSNPTKMGFLEKKQDKLFTLWQKRYCVLHKNVFYLFKKLDKKQQGAFVVSGYEFREAPYLAKDERKRDLYFELVCPAKKTYQFLCESKDDLLAWKEVLQAAANNQPLAENDNDIYEEFSETGDKGKNQQTVADEIYDEAASEKTPAKQPQVSAVPPPLKKSGPASLPTPDVKERAKTPEVDDDDLLYEPLDAIALPKVATPGVKVTQSTLLSAATAPGTVKNPKSPTGTSPEQPPPIPPHRVPEPLSPSHKPQELPPPPLPSHKGHESGGQLPPPLPGRALPPPPTEPLPPVPSTPKKMICPSLGNILHPSEDFENLFYGKWDCTGSSANELSFKRGQIVHVISQELDDWWVGALEDKVGLVPKSFLCPAYELVR